MNRIVNVHKIYISSIEIEMISLIETSVSERSKRHHICYFYNN